MAHTAPQGVWHEENWASQFLREKGHAIGTLEVWRRGGKRRLVDGRFATNKEIINKAREYEDWKGRECLSVEYLNRHQASLVTNAR
jgi:hypothetical protein